MSDRDTTARPDYQGGSIVNLMGSVREALGGRAGGYPPLRALPPETLGGARHVVLVVLDGLGYEYLRSVGAGGQLYAHLRGSMTSVFPTTTASAVTTFLTGTAPQQHGLTGWFMHLRELGMVAAVLPFRSRGGWLSLEGAGIDPAVIMGCAPFADQLAVPAHIVTQQRIRNSAYSELTAGRAARHGYSDLDGFFGQIARLLHEARERCYIYAYWPQFDALAHPHGVASAPVREHFRAIDRAFGLFLESVAGTDAAVIVTADHGFLDVGAGGYVELADHPELADCLSLPLCGEPRVAYCYVRPGSTSRFERYVQDHLSDRCWLYRSEELIHGGLFGAGAPHPRLADRVGDYALVMKGEHAIKDTLVGETGFRPVGLHGGLSGAEMHVPLIVAEA